MCFSSKALQKPAKTTVALQFLLEGARSGEKGLYITLSETERELREGAASHGWKSTTISRSTRHPTRTGKIH
jgi:KaiC/GvpD/RAD55 family RecA-like ATPase